jgi:hypothetical protein
MPASLFPTRIDVRYQSCPNRDLIYSNCISSDLIAEGEKHILKADGGVLNQIGYKKPTEMQG